MLNPSSLVLSLIALAASVVGGVAIGLILARGQRRRILAEAALSADRIRTLARRSAELSTRETATRIREQALIAESSRQDEIQALRVQIEERQEHSLKRDSRLKRGQLENTERNRAASKRQSALDKSGLAIQKIERAVQARVAEERNVLARRCGESDAVICKHIASQMVARARSQTDDRLRNFEAVEGEGLGQEALRIVNIAIERYNGAYSRVRSGSIVALEKGHADRIRGEAERAFTALKEISGAGFTISEDDHSLRIETGDGVARELFRRALGKILAANRGALRQAEEIIRSLESDFSEEIERNGQAAFRALGLTPAVAEITDLIGRLTWRTSYTQNQYKHSIEAAQIAGLICAELGLDPQIGRRGTLLHDMGKALSHRVDGSHALLGSEIARRHGEREEVANAIGAHHGEEPIGSPYASLTAASDALSGGRPGARREQSEAYGDRIGDLERVAAGFKGVHSVHAVQAGREIRIYVDDRKVGDDAISGLAEDIAGKISEEIVFPGQIRVTVLREFRALAQAG